LEQLAEPLAKARVPLVVIRAWQRGSKVAEGTARHLLDLHLRLADLIEEPGDALRTGQRAVAQRPRHQRLEISDLRLQHRERQLLFGAKMIVKITLGDAALLEDV